MKYIVGMQIGTTILVKQFAREPRFDGHCAHFLLLADHIENKWILYSTQ